MSRENFEKILEQSNASDWETASQAWFRYNHIVGGIAKTFGFPVEVGVAVFAALSPNNDYLGNIRDTARLLSAAEAGAEIQDFKVSTYGANKRKAWQIVKGENPLDVITANKTRNFFLNVANPSDPYPVTVDGHIFNAWSGKRIPLNSAEMKRYAKYYSEVADEIRQIGLERRIIPNVVQGVIWYCWKRIHRIKLSGQLELWDSDFIVAGLGFEKSK